MLVVSVPVGNAIIIGPSQGSVEYKVTVNVNSLQANFLPINNESFTVNETVVPAVQSDFVNLTLRISSNIGNFSYSKDANSSALPLVFPFLPDLTNQSFSYQFQTINLHMNYASIGQVQLTFNGTSYQATKYFVFFTASNNASSVQGNGTITALPSGLIYNTELTVNQTVTIDATLLSTNLSLASPSVGVSAIEAPLIGVGVVAAVIVAALIIFVARKKTRRREKQEIKYKVNPYDVD